MTSPRIEMPKQNVLYKAVPIGDVKRLLVHEQEFISSFCDPKQGKTLIQKAMDQGVAGAMLRVEFLFASGNRGGVQFVRL